MTAQPLFAPHPVLAGLGAARSTLARLSEASLVGLSANELAGAVADAHRLVAQAESVAMLLTVEADARDVARSQGATSTAAMIAGAFGGDRAAAARELKVAQQLQTSAPLTQKAMAQGQVSREQAEVITRGCQMVCVRGVGSLLKEDTDDHDR